MANGQDWGSAKWQHSKNGGEDLAKRAKKPTFYPFANDSPKPKFGDYLPT